jgi:hypothetical protein
MVTAPRTSSSPSREPIRPQSGEEPTADRAVSTAQVSGLNFDAVRIHPGMSAGAMKMEERNVRGSSRNWLTPMIDS